MAKDSISYNNEFKKDHYDRVTVLVSKGKKAELKQLADDNGISVNKLVLEAVEDKYDVKLIKPKSDRL